MLNDPHLSPQQGQSPIDGSLPGNVEPTLSERVAAQFKANVLSPGAAEFFQEASRGAGYDGFFSRVFEVRTLLENAGLDVQVTHYNLLEEKLTPIVSLVATDPVSGLYVVPGVVSSSRYIQEEGGSSSGEPGKKYLASATEYEDPETGARTTFKIETFKSEAALICAPGYESADEPCEFSVIQSKGNVQQALLSLQESLESHGEHYSYLLEEVALPVVQRQLVGDSGNMVGQFERPAIDFVCSSFDTASGSLVLALFVPTSGAPERFTYRLGFTPELEVVVEDMTREPLGAEEL